MSAKQETYVSCRILTAFYSGRLIPCLRRRKAKLSCGDKAYSISGCPYVQLPCGTMRKPMAFLHFRREVVRDSFSVRRSVSFCLANISHGRLAVS